MAATNAGRRVSYDRLWGAVLLASCLIPAQISGEGALELRFIVPDDPTLTAWLIGGAAVGLIALGLGLAGARGRWRHSLNILLGGSLLAFPLVVPSLFESVPLADPARFSFNKLGSMGQVMLFGLGAIYIGAGIRVARPTQFAGMALSTIGALVVALFACLPVSVGGSGFASERVLQFADLGAHWTGLVPVVLVAASVLCAIFNMVRNDYEVLLARASRLLLVGALLYVILLPFLVGKDDEIIWHAPAAFGAIRFFGPLFLAVDGAIAFTAISITRTQE
ncbi:MAG: hypothetical protein AAGD14_19660 [Planctomycetota bacterium]